MTPKGDIYLAADLGASSGRVLAGRFAAGQLEIELLHRFPNGPIAVGERLHWDILGLWREVQEGLRAATHHFAGHRFVSVGVDSWGVDFGLIGPGDELLGNPYCYRDRRTAGVMERSFKTVSAKEIFSQTGLQFMEFNSLYQLIAWQQSGTALLDIAEHLLLIPDLFHWLMTGEKLVEQTNATTTQFFNPTSGTWTKSLFESFDLPTNILPAIVPPGTPLGPLKKQVAAATRLKEVEVVLPGTHDTASAVMAVPSTRTGGLPDWCYISSGTWSLMGVELPQPIINDECRQLNFTNEGGVGGTTRLLKNIMGLWLVQECRRIWSMAGQDYNWDKLMQLARQSRPLTSLISPNDPQFIKPDDMPAAISTYCRETSQPTPNTPGTVIRCALESLALEYRRVFHSLERLVGCQLKTIHIVGGGAQNRLLCQMTADACQRPVMAGPVEATAIGNIMVQAITTGGIGSIAEARQVIRNSFDVEEYAPQNPEPWNEAFEKFQAMHH